MFGIQCRRAQFETYPLTVAGWSEPLDYQRLHEFTDPWDTVIWEQAKVIFDKNLQRFNVSAQTCQQCLLEAEWSVEAVGAVDWSGRDRPDVHRHR